MIKEFIKGADLSSLYEVERCGARYRDSEGEADAMTIFRRHGANLVRLRLWNDPYSPDGEPYGAGSNNLSVTRALARRAKALGMSWMLDFHYSDFWADPGKQFPPKAWAGLDEEGLTSTVYSYTKETLEKLKEQGIPPEFIAVGNEITNGLLWPVGKVPNFDAIAKIVSAGIGAVREVLPEAKTVIHLDNGGKNELYRYWFDSYFAAGGADFDVMGLSYYPFWHGKMAGLSKNMNDMAERYGKEMIVVETSMGFSLEDYADIEHLADGARKGFAANEKLASLVDYPMTPKGQKDFLSDLVAVIKGVPNGLGHGFIWWEPAWLPVPGSHWARPAGLEYTHEEGPGGNEWANQTLFDYRGNALPALYSYLDF